MYAPGTILKLRKQLPPIVLEGKGEEGEDIKVPHPYNRVRVVNQSPINHGAPAGGEWDGSHGQGVIITPLDSHGATVDKPYGLLQDIYAVEEIPSQELVAPTVRVIESNSGSAGASPEEQFAEAAKKAGIKPPKDGKRGRTPFDFPEE